MTIKVIAPGLATTVQDLGRPGYYHLGIPISGGMDRFALRAANMLVGNDEGAAVLEAVFMGPELEFTQDAIVAVTGADLPPKVNGEVRESWTSFEVKAGQILSFDYLKQHARDISLFQAASTCRWCWEAVPPMPWARWGASKGVHSLRVTNCS